ncbi:MAG: glutamate--cysteine ligase [Gemmatimonadetes bacterium]|nr:glutamate--cysteine ligase [Gemmatimonadota bacterium]NNL30580.1 glutamate--cysteine ligase [Gemmatimonadota bacterium]
MSRLGLFDGYGVEIEYMIVDAESLDIRPVCDRLMEAMAGEPVSELERGDIAWSNELVLHVLELKTNGPASALAGLGKRFQAEVATADAALVDIGCRLLPGGVHPWMDPETETHLWPHEYNVVYEAFDRIFGCSGHGWSNLQSTHLNLPFDGDREFGRLHAAIRAVIPLIPALAASSPFLESALTPQLDARLEAYRGNARRIPEVAGGVVPDPVGSEQEYRDRILQPLYDALAPHDPDGVLRHEWANARGSIARFERGAIEIRVIDAQECVSADLAVVSMVVAVVRALCEERWATTEALDAIPTAPLSELFVEAVRVGGDAPVVDPRYLKALGWSRSEATALGLWRFLADRLAPDGVPAEYASALETIVGHGPLASRMVKAHTDDGRSIRAVAAELGGCLRDDRLFGK